MTRRYVEYWVSHRPIQMCQSLCLIFVAFICCFPKLGYSQDVSSKGVLTLSVYTYNVDWSNHSSQSFQNLQNDTETAIRESLTEGLTFQNLIIFSPSDGLLNIYFTVNGEVANVSAWLKSLAHPGIVIRESHIPVVVQFFSQGGKLLQVDAQDVCEIRISLQPCKPTETCSNGECKTRTIEETSDIQNQEGNLIVLAYGGALLLILLFCLLICCGWNYYRIRQKRLADKIVNRSTQNGGI